MSESAFETTLDKDGVTITLKADANQGTPWLVLRYTSVEAALAAFKKEDGAELMELMRNVAGAAKAFKATWNNEDIPSRTQGKPEAAGTPSPQVTTKADPFKVDDAPPFGDEDNTPTCKHGKMQLVVHKGTKGYVCASGLPREDPERCASVMV